MFVVLVPEFLEDSAEVYTIDFSYHLFDLIPPRSCLYDHNLPYLLGTEPYRNTPPTTNLSLKRHTSNDIWLVMSPNTSDNMLFNFLPDFSDMADSIPNTKLHAFNRKDTTYTSDDLSIGVSVFVPKSAEKCQTLPVLVRWHGGALINGGRVHEPWFPKWYVLSRIRGSLQDKRLS
jgi:hypothetical protein